MNFGGWVRTSTVDFPGRLATVVFTRGCDMDCFFCHNRPLLGPDVRPALEESEVLEHLERRTGVLDGLVLSGGEPLLQPDLIPFIRKVRALGYAIKLDTNGAHPDRLEQLLLAEDHPLAEYVAMDYKAPWDRYPDICGCPDGTAALVQRSLDLLFECGRRNPEGAFRWELRTTVIPQLSVADLEQMARAVPQVPRYALQLYRPPDNYKPEDRFRVLADAMTPGMLQDAGRRILPFQSHVLVRA